MSDLAIGSARGRAIGGIAAPRWRMTLAAGLLCVLALLGGASRSDEPQQVLVPLMALAALVAGLLPLDFAPFRDRTRLLLWIGAVWLLPLLQLIPLPPAVWAALPGHAPYAAIAAATGTTRWRPPSLVPDLTIGAWLFLLVPTAMAFAAAYLDRHERGFLLALAAALGGASAVLGLMQLAAGPEGLRLFRITSEAAPVGFFANRNHQAAFLACALPLATTFAGSRLRRGGNPRTVLLLLAIGGALFLSMLAATGSRMGIVLGLFGLGGSAWCWKGHGLPLVPRGSPARLRAGAVAVVLALVVLTAAWRGGAPDRLARTEFAEESRSASLAPMLTTARAFAPWGAGMGSFDSVYRRFEPDALLSTIYLNEAHDEPMQLAIEGGVPALVLLAIFLVWWLSRTDLRAASTTQPGGRRAQVRAAVTVTAILMASSLVDYPLRTPLLAALFALCCVELADAGRADPRPREGG